MIFIAQALAFPLMPSHSLPSIFQHSFSSTETLLLQIAPELSLQAAELTLRPSAVCDGQGAVTFSCMPGVWPVPQAPEPTQSIRGAPLQKGCGKPLLTSTLDRRSSLVSVDRHGSRPEPTEVRWRLSAMLKARYVVDFSNHASSLAYCQKLYREQHNENTSC